MSDTPPVTPDDVIVITGPEQATIQDPPDRPDAGLPPVIGAQAWQVFRATRDAPELADGLGWTYNHHVDMAVWKGRYYVAWNQCERDEDVWPSREVFSTSVDGAAWGPPCELFPMGLSTCLRMYFYVARNGRMLAIAGLRVSREEVQEETKGNLIVREIRPDHTLGPVHALQLLEGTRSDLPMFDASPDPAFVDACRDLMANSVYLEQQDLGTLLPGRRMKWHDPANWPGGRVPGDSDKWRSGKAFSFFRRPDGLRVGVSKMGFTTVSADEGATWSRPVVPPTLVTGKAKVWAQRTADGRYALVYNPTRRSRYPLVVAASDDGQHFGPMRVVQGELPRQRYQGAQRSVGPQYTRGLSEWSTDGSIADDALWLVYSMSKEDIWVSRVPLPITPDATTPVNDDFATFAPGPRLPSWNTYQPKWADVSIEDSRLVLSNRDPFDYALATKTFPPSQQVTVEFDVMASQNDRGRFEISLCGPGGDACAVRIVFDSGGRIVAWINSQAIPIDTYASNRMLAVRIQVDADVLNIAIDDQTLRHHFSAPMKIDRLVFRTGEHRNIGGKTPVNSKSDVPITATTFAITQLKTETT